MKKLDLKMTESNRERMAMPTEPEDAGRAPRQGAVTSLLVDAFERVHESVPAVLDGLSVDEVLWRPDRDANSIGWLIWHLARVQDSHLSDLVDAEQVWDAGWSQRFPLPYEPSAIGYGQTSQQVGMFTLDDLSLLTGYCDAVQTTTRDILIALEGEDLHRVIDDSWDPPVTLGVRLVSVVNDITQHIGQAAYVKGLVERRR